MGWAKQTSLSPGNCWQTCIGHILGVDPAELPDQTLADCNSSYLNRLNAYLERHHADLVYVEARRPVIDVVRPPEGLHVLVGPTVRTALSGDNHVVVAQAGEMIFDPHPSDAGLLEVEAWGLLAKLPLEWKEHRVRRRANGEHVVCCVCPRCA